MVAGVIVQTPLPLQPAPDTLNAIVSSPALALASRIACRSEPAPESAVFVTVYVFALTAEAAARSTSAAPRARLEGRLSSFELRLQGFLDHMDISFRVHTGGRL